MKCPTCVSTGLRSRVYVGMSTRTLMGVTTYYNEDGELVVDDPNITTTNYQCSNAHTWVEKTRAGGIIDTAQGTTGEV